MICPVVVPVVHIGFATYPCYVFGDDFEGELHNAIFVNSFISLLYDIRDIDHIPEALTETVRFIDSSFVEFDFEIMLLPVRLVTSGIDKIFQRCNHLCAPISLLFKFLI